MIRTAAGDRWRTLLAAWAIPDAVLAAAPANPFAIPSELFDPEHQRCSDHAVALAAAALPPGGSVLDVGCAGGAASVPLARSASRITGVDADPAMAALFEAVTVEEPAAVRVVCGRWPDVAAAVEVHDVVTSHHVVYNVAVIEDFLVELTAHARGEVVLEVTLQHPQAELNDLWQKFHGIERPTRPVLEDLVAVVTELAIAPRVTPTRRPDPPQPLPRDLLVAFARQRLCLGPDADAAVDAALPRSHRVPPRQVACLSWSGTADHDRPTHV